jgi:hypothetical protein
MLKRCRLCSNEKPLTDFHKNRLNRDGHDSRCKSCAAEAQRSYIRDNREKYNKRQRRQRKKNPASAKAAVQKWVSNNKHKLRARHLRKSYGLPLEVYDEMLKAQNGVCVICRGPGTLQNGKRASLVVDHCHKTGKVRGLLCHNCNVGIGNLRDDPELLRTALAYLEAESPWPIILTTPTPPSVPASRTSAATAPA